MDKERLLDLIFDPLILFQDKYNFIDGTFWYKR